MVNTRNGFLVSGRASKRRRLRNIFCFTQSSFKKLEHLGDTAVDAQRYDEAISCYSAALSLNSASLRGILIKRSKAHVATGSWKQALDDANQVHTSFLPHGGSVLLTHHRQVITLDPLSPWGHERKHAALHRAGRYDDAIATFETMLLKISQSPDPQIRGEYIDIISIFVY